MTMNIPCSFADRHRGVRHVPGRSARRQRGTQAVNRSAQGAGDHPPGRTAVAHDRPAGRWRTRGAERFLSQYAGTESDRPYAYLLVDHLRWLEHEGLAPENVGFRDLERYMGAVGAKVAAPLGSPWRVGKRPYGNSALSSAASCLKGFYLRQAELGINTELAETLDKRRMPTRQDRDRVLLGHITRDMVANPLAPRRIRRPASENAAGRRPGVAAARCELGS
ncbi:hypothetical protein ACIQPR_46800 [Streptomyces sp. NPDC091280]|uniref:hypothetical protein n=1 Tax=Streptomyces sp. NPDC091280 TaxID=3365984 RepID=UPI00381F8498